MATLRVTSLRGRTSGTSPTLPDGAVVTGVTTSTSAIVGSAVTINSTGIDAGAGIITATSFVGNVTGNVTGNATGLTGTPDITIQNVTGVAGTFTGFVAFSTSISVGGTITYEDVTNIDSVGIITAQSDISIADKIIHTGDTNTAIRFPAADTFTVETAGSERFRIHSTGISHFKAGLAEKVNVKTQLTSANACAITDGNVILTTSAEPGNTYPDITGVHSVLSSGEGFSVTIALKVDGSGTINGFRIDGVAQTIEWSGGSAPSAGSDGYDVFTFSAFKTGSGTTDYKVFGAATNYT